MGSQLYVNRGDTVEQIRAWVDRMHDSRMRIIRLFLLWDLIEPREGTFTWEQYDAVFERAAECGMGVVPTLMCVSPPGWMRASRGSQSVVDLDDPAYWRVALEHVKTVAAHYEDAPALHSWILWNEPGRTIAVTPHSLEAYRAFMRERYGDDIERVNARHYPTYDSFEQLGQTYREGTTATEFRVFDESVDWLSFTVDNLNRKLRDIAAAVREAGSAHPIHTNPHNIGGNIFGQGQDLWAEAAYTDFTGCSAHPPHHSTRFPRHRVPYSVGMFADMSRSASPHPDGYFWVTELQGGITLFSASHASTPRASNVEQWLWEIYGAGARAVVFWCFNWRTAGWEGGEWGLLNQAGEVSERLATATRVAETIESNQDLFDAAVPRAPDAYLLYSRSSIILRGLEGRGRAVTDPRADRAPTDAFSGAYMLLRDLGYEVGFVPEDYFVQLGGGTPPVEVGGLPELGDAALVIAPDTYALPDAAVAGLERFVELGGTLVADGLFAYKNPDGGISDAGREAGLRIFGAKMIDIAPFEGDPKGRIAEGDLKSWFYEIEFAPGGDARQLLAFDTNCPAVIEHGCGSGTGVRIATVLFQQYMAWQSEQWRDGCAALFAAAGIAPRGDGITIRSEGRLGFRSRALHSGDRVVALLFNGPTSQRADVASTSHSTWTTLYVSAGSAVLGADEHGVAVDLATDGVAVLLGRG